MHPFAGTPDLRTTRGEARSAEGDLAVEASTPELLLYSSLPVVLIEIW
jgi:hypothetical protein